MKTYLLSLCFILTAAVGFSQLEPSDQNTDGPMMNLESLVVDYGEIEQNSEPLRVLNFTNTGTEPLIIKSARGSCGCTVPEWPKEPIMPGEASTIEIRYATNRLGKFSKTVTLTTNEDGEPRVIKVQGNVSQGEDSVPEAPANIFKDAAKQVVKDGTKPVHNHNKKN